MPRSEATRFLPWKPGFSSQKPGFQGRDRAEVHGRNQGAGLQLHSLNDGHECDHASSGVCPAGPPLTLHDAWDRFAREATQGVFDTGRYRCPYFDWGNGPPLLFIPGAAATGRSFVFTIARLTAFFRCIAYDLPTGRGDGARLGRTTHADLVADTFALLDHLGIRQAYLFGSSFGATIALSAMHARPERTPRAILQGGFAWRPLARSERNLARMARYWPGTMRFLPFRTKALRMAHYGPFADRPPEIWDYFIKYTGEVPIATLARHVLLLHSTDLRSILSTIRQPILMVCGDRDSLVRQEHEEPLLSGLPNVRRLELDNCGHFPYLTHAEVLAEIIRSFFTPSSASNTERT
jgi:pimeloyl-ACP methyl ester carboxylesterase